MTPRQRLSLAILARLCAGLAMRGLTRKNGGFMGDDFKRKPSEGIRSMPAAAEHGPFKKFNDDIRSGRRVIETLSVSRAKPTLPRVPFLEGKDDF